MNLIEQQNVLKGLTDESLQAEMAQPSGSTPPFLIATEVSRRKAARDRYEGAKAKAQPSTVMDDLRASMAPAMPGAVPAMDGIGAALPPAGMMPQAPGGLDAAMPPAPVQAFAEGGPVGGLDYAAIGDRYAETLESLPARRDRARALALLNAGAGIMSGGSSNFLTNIGKGVTAGTTSYGTALDEIDDDEQRALAAALDLQRVQQGDALQRLQFDWNKERAGQEDDLTREGWARTDAQPPASIRETEAYLEMSPEEQATYDKLNPPPASTTLTADLRLAEQFNDIQQQVEKAYPPLAPLDTMGKTPGEVDALISARNQRVQLQTLSRIRATYGPEAAAKYARQAGISDGDALTGGGDVAPMGGDDPLGLGL